MPIVRWDRVPVEFHYLRDAVEGCGETRVSQYDRNAGRHLSFFDTATGLQLELIRAAKEEVESRGDRLPMEQWCISFASPQPSVRNAVWYIQGMLLLFDQLDTQQAEQADQVANDE
jgi:hypothetical protein